MHSSSESKVFFLKEDIPAFKLNSRTKLKRFLVSLFKKERVGLKRLTYVFCSDRYLHSLNKKYLQHDELTDIITFELSEKPGPVMADVFISIDRIRENALTHLVKPEHELLRVIFHGALHLVGYSDKTKSGKLKMRQKEEYYLKTFKSST